MFILFLNILAAALLSGESGIEKKYSSIAFDLENNKPLYIEKHIETKNSDSFSWTTNYLDTNGTLISSRKIEFIADSLIPNFELNCFRTGYLEGAEKIGVNKLHIYTRSDSSEVIERDTLVLEKEYVVDAGLTFFFRKNWDRLQQGETIEFDFIAPAKLDYFGFRVSKRNSFKIGERFATELILEPSSFIIRQFVDPIYVSYYNDSKEIVEYRGISNVNDFDGNSYDVKIKYHDSED